MNAYLPNPRAIVGGRLNHHCLAIGALNFPVAFPASLLNRAQHFWRAMSVQEPASLARQKDYLACMHGHQQMRIFSTLEPLSATA